MLLLGALVLLAGAGLLLRPALRAAGAAPAVLGAGVVLGTAAARLLQAAAAGDAVRAGDPDAAVRTSLELGGWLLVPVLLAALATAALGLLSLHAPGRQRT